VRPSQALLVPFLGRYAWTSRLPAYLATVTGCAAVPMVCVPLEDGRYRMTFDEPILPEGEGDDEIEKLTRRYAAALEPHIRARPELWLWMHSRWQRTRKQHRPEAIARLIEESGLPPARPLHDLARRAPAGSPIEQLASLATDDFVESARHLLLVSPGDRAGSGAAAAFAGAVVRLGHATRYFSLRELCDRLGRALAEGRLDAELRDLDRISLLVIADAEPGNLDPAQLDLCGRLLRHRLDRGSVVLAGAAAGTWRQAARVDASTAVDAFLDACEVVDLSGLDAGAFATVDTEPARPEASGDAAPSSAPTTSERRAW
jgi:hypothetical protein